MTRKVYPNYTTICQQSVPAENTINSTTGTGSLCKNIINNTSVDSQQAVALTVWKKSLLLNCKGFTVFDGKGNLVFRVDNYVAANRGEIVLMDASGIPLLTIRRKRLSWGDKWLVYDGETSVNPIYLAHKQGNLLSNSKTMSLAQIFSSNNTNNKCNTRKDSLLYQIEGSYAQRRVAVYNNKRQCVAEIKSKETTKGVALGGDVFKLIIVRPDDIDTTSAMALVILLDQMFGSS